MDHASKEVRRRCDELIETLRIPVPFTMSGFLAELSARRGTPIVLWSIEATDALPSGMIMRTDGIDYLFVVRGTSRVHARHIVFHEIGHDLFGHTCDRHLSVLRTNARRREEDEAEVFAYRLAARIRQEERRTRITASYQQLLAALGARRRLSPRHA